MSLPYAIDSYDDYFCLKPPFLLWIAALYLSRSVVVVAAIWLCTAAGVEKDAIHVLWGIWSVDALAPSLIAAGVLFALFRRTPDSPRVVRWIWNRGRGLLAASALIDLGLAFATPFWSPARSLSGDAGVVTWMTIALDGYFLAYVLLARRVRDSFASFPVPLNQKP
jgi:hypothetical protein